MSGVNACRLAAGAKRNQYHFEVYPRFLILGLYAILAIWKHNIGSESGPYGTRHTGLVATHEVGSWA